MLPQEIACRAKATWISKTLFGNRIAFVGSSESFALAIKRGGTDVETAITTAAGFEIPGLIERLIKSPMFVAMRDGGAPDAGWTLRGAVAEFVRGDFEACERLRGAS